ncbi:hypothetical protein BGZ88_002778 [Linnemannia elongata]|nr:hypothetical protein BGZ88_002778 [Linnemannia elongata]
MRGSLDIIIANKGPDDTINVRYKPDEPISFLLKRIHAQLGTNETSIFRQDLFLSGMKLKDHNKTMAHYRIFGNTLTYRAINEGEIVLYVIYSGKTLKLSCSSVATIAHVKQILQTKEGIPPNQQQLIFEYQHLKNDRKLCEYNIQHETTLLLTLTMWGGGTFYGGAALPGIMFADISDASGVTKVQFSKTAPPGRFACPGTNVECKCECTPNYMVICMEKFSTLELSRATFICPNCDESDRITPITIGFMQCKYRFHGIKGSGEQYTSDWKEVNEDDCYQLFKPDKQVHWRRLVIESTGLDECDECSICLEELRKFDTLGCGHQFHAECIEQWDGSCPNCRYNRHLVSGHEVEIIVEPKRTNKLASGSRSGADWVNINKV